jgi:hypothetical protein
VGSTQEGLDLIIQLVHGANPAAFSQLLASPIIIGSYVMKFVWVEE